MAGCMVVIIKILLKYFCKPFRNQRFANETYLIR